MTPVALQKRDLKIEDDRERYEIDCVIQNNDPWVPFDVTSVFSIVDTETILDNTIINYSFQKIGESALGFWNNPDDDYWDEL